MTGMYLILFHDLMSPMLGDITIIFLMISYFYDITISWHHNLYGLFLYRNKCGSYIFDPYKKYAVYYLLSLCMNVMFQDFFV